MLYHIIIIYSTIINIYNNFLPFQVAVSEQLLAAVLLELNETSYCQEVHDLWVLLIMITVNAHSLTKSLTHSLLNRPKPPHPMYPMCGHQF